MAYKQSPGRQMMPKTGKGIPSPLLQEDPELTRKGIESRKKLLAEEAKRIANKNDIQGIQIDPTTGKATARPYGKKFIGGKAESSNEKVPTGESTNAKIIDVNGKLVKEARKTVSLTSNEDLYKEHERDSTYTMSSRNNYARFYNVQAGKESPTAKETRSGQNRGFYTK